MWKLSRMLRCILPNFQEMGCSQLSSCPLQKGDAGRVSQVLFAILLAALGIAQAQMSFPDITQAAAAIDRVFGTIDRKTTIDSSSDDGT